MEAQSGETFGERLRDRAEGAFGGFMAYLGFAQQPDGDPSVAAVTPPTNPADIAPAATATNEAAPYIDDRQELTRAVDKLCLAMYWLASNRQTSAANEERIVYDRQTGEIITTPPSEIQLGSGYEDCLLITDEKFGSTEYTPITTPNRCLDNVRLPKEEENRLYMKALLEGKEYDEGADSYYDLYAKPFDVEARYKELCREAAGEHIIVSYIAAAEDGLNVVTIDEDNRRVIGVERTRVNPDDLFVPSEEQPEHQRLYGIVFAKIADMVGSKYLPHANDEAPKFQVMRQGNAPKETDYQDVNITEDVLDPRVFEALGRPRSEGGVGWPLLDSAAGETALQAGENELAPDDTTATYDPYPLAEAAASPTPSQEENSETTLRPLRYDDPAVINAIRQILGDYPLHIPQATADVESYKRTLRSIQERSLALLTPAAANELAKRNTSIEKVEEFTVVLKGSDRIATYDLWYGFHKKYGESIVLSARSRRSTDYESYEIMTIETAKGAIRDKGTPISPLLAPAILNILNTVDFTYHPSSS